MFPFMHVKAKLIYLTISPYGTSKNFSSLVIQLEGLFPSKIGNSTFFTQERGGALLSASDSSLLVASSSVLLPFFTEFSLPVLMILCLS